MPHQDVANSSQEPDYVRERQPSVLNVLADKKSPLLTSKYRVVGVAERDESEISRPLSDEEQELKENNHDGKSSLWTNWWLWEILSGILSVICIVAIFLILFAYEKEVPQMHYGITVSASS
jgi:hypothetical protein